ncbi:unnamed protein product [Microthlaspi erraticum]|uniref:Uncharacterized protein n=1 Tax=Microthlaspi erraticum TaxID=1685480 RepID=A0A6D2IWM6_9BRAS|nr:unnamed protein product [Microthlaspi erraticum]
MRKPTIEGQLFYIEEWISWRMSFWKSCVWKIPCKLLSPRIHLKGIAFRTEECSRLLDTFRPVPNIFCIEGLDEPLCEVLAVSSTENSIESGHEQTSSIELDRCKEQAQGDWSELKAPKVDLKPLPKGLRYAFLGENSTYPVIVNSELNLNNWSALLVELRKYRRIGYTLDDIKGISS